jgi:hypothetical protein
MNTPEHLMWTATTAKSAPLTQAVVTTVGGNGVLGVKDAKTVTLYCYVNGTSLSVDVYCWSASAGKYVLYESTECTTGTTAVALSVPPTDAIYVGTSSLSTVTSYKISGRTVV